MKNITLFSLVAASLLFTACGEKTDKAVEETPTTAVVIEETVKEDSVGALDAAKKSIAEAAEAAKTKAAEMAETAKAEASKMADAAAEKATEATEAIKEKATEATEAVTAAVTPGNAAGKEAYAKCAGCHGADGQTKALGKANVVAGQTAAALAEALQGYKAGTRNVSGMGMLMKGQVASMDDETITAVSEYMSGL